MSENRFKRGARWRPESPAPVRRTLLGPIEAQMRALHPYRSDEWIEAAVAGAVHAMTRAIVAALPELESREDGARAAARRVEAKRALRVAALRPIEALHTRAELAEVLGDAAEVRDLEPAPAPLCADCLDVIGDGSALTGNVRPARDGECCAVCRREE